MMYYNSNNSVTSLKPFSNEERDRFYNSLFQFGNGEKPIESVLSCLGPSRHRGETAILAREELKRILEKREDIEDVLGLESGNLWTLEEEKLFEYGLYINDASTPDRFGAIANVMYGSKTRDECKKRYMKLILDICQIELGSKSLTMVYYSPAPYQQMNQASQPQWML